MGLQELSKIYNRIRINKILKVNVKIINIRGNNHNIYKIDIVRIIANKVKIKVRYSNK